MELAMLREQMQKLASGSVPQPELLQGNALAITPVPSGISVLDEALMLGGLPAGRVVEIAGSASSGKTALGLRLLAEQTRAGKLVAYVDGTGQFYPPAAAAMGIDLKRTLLIAPSCKRIRSRDDAVTPIARAVEIIARSRAFSMILVDLPPSARVDRVPARRLRTAAQATGTTIIALSTRCGDVEGAATRIESSPCQALRSHLRRTQFRIAKGGRGMSPHVEISCKQHRFDSRPPCQVAPIQYRAMPGEEAPGARLGDSYSSDPYSSSPYSSSPYSSSSH